MSSPRKLLRRALDALEQIEADATRIPAARRALDEALGVEGYQALVRAREVVARSLAAVQAAPAGAAESGQQSREVGPADGSAAPRSGPGGQ